MLEFLFEIKDQEKLFKVVELFKSFESNAMKELSITKREEILKIILDSKPIEQENLDYRKLFDLPQVFVNRINEPIRTVPEVWQNENAIRTDGMFSHLNK